MAANSENRQNYVNCPKCRHYYVTWDKAFPRGCRLYGFKTASMPSFSVLEATGARCANFAPRQGAGPDGR
jgi:hypothetical protein